MSRSRRRLREEVERLPLLDQEYAKLLHEFVALKADLAEHRAVIRELADIVGQWHASWLRGDEGDSLDHRTKKILADPLVVAARTSASSGH